MKLFQLLFALMLTFFNTYAQKDLPSVGKIGIEDLQMTDCSFDKGAEAVKLIDWGNVLYERGTEGMSLFKQVNERRVRIKILKEKGLSYANLTIPYYSFNNDQKISKIEAYTFNIDEAGKVKVTVVGKSSIYTKKINRRSSQLIIAFPEVKVGSVIEYKFKMEREAYWIINDWYFQERIPVQYSEYQLKVPAFFQFKVHPVITIEPEVKSTEYPESISTSFGPYDTKILKRNYIMRNLPGIKEEPFMGSIKDYQQRLEFNFTGYDFGNGNAKDFSTNWADVVKTLNEDEDFGSELLKDLSDAAPAISEANAIAGEEARMKFIFNYVQKNFNWNGDESIYSFEGIKKTWEKKSGSTGDINILLTVLLNKAGIKAFPILLSTRENGLVNSMYPFVTQFNVVMTYVTIDSKFFVLDATDKTANYKLIPGTVANTSGFVVTGERGKWVDAIDNHKYKMMTALHGEMDASGILTGECLVNCSDYARKERTDDWRKDKEQFKKYYFTANGTATKIEELVVNNAEADSLPLEQKVKFSQQLSSSGDYKYFNINMFTGFGRNPFLGDERLADIDFGYQQEYSIFCNISIPQGYSFDELPKNTMLVTPDGGVVFNRIMQVEDNLLNVRITIEFKRNFYPAADYPDFAAFYKKLLSNLNEQIVIKKKTAP